MSLISNKPLDLIKEEDIQALIDARVSESKVVEYKKELPKLDTADDKKEFLADVSSFANASGGDLIYGIIAKEGVPEHLFGLEIDVPVERITMRLENIIRSNIEPKIPGLSIVEIPVLTNRYIVIIRIPRSWASPHMITLERKGDARFFSRFSKGKFDLDVSEIRAAFVLSETRSERIRKFRADRIGKIIAGETPVKLKEDPKVVLHIIPLSAHDPGSILDIAHIAKDARSLTTINSGGGNWRYNFEGYLLSSQMYEGNTHESYLQIFRNGIIESVETHFTYAKNGELKIANRRFDGMIYERLPEYISIYKKFHLEPPFLVMLSLLGASGYSMDFSSFIRPSQKIDQDVLLVPEHLIESFEYDCDSVTKQILDPIWNAAGFEKSHNFGEDGKLK